MTVTQPQASPTSIDPAGTATSIPAKTTKPTSEDKAIVKDYFNTTGFDRWQRIYGDGEVSKVQRDIREGHQRTIDLVTYWLKTDAELAPGGSLSGRTVCDAGCGVGSLSVPLAQLGATVSGSDLSEKMIGEAQARAAELGFSDDRLHFETRDLEAIDGSYDIVACIDVLIHYPDEEMEDMLAHLSSLAKSRLILSFAPKAGIYVALKKIGSLFPGPSKATRAYLHRVGDVVQILRRQGWEVRRREFVGTSFYFAQLVEAVRVGDR